MSSDPLDSERWRRQVDSSVANLRALSTARRVVEHPLDPDDLDDELSRVADTGTDQLRAATWRRRIPQRFHQATLETVAKLHPAVVGDLRAWAADPAGTNLVLAGPVGVGKSATAVAACQPAHFDGLEVKFLPVDELLDLLRPGGPERALYDLAAIDRLIIDDLGAERATDWTHERLYALVNRRYLECLPTVVTTNLPLRASPDHEGSFEQAVGPRMFSRLVGHDAVVLQLAGPDLRRHRP